MSTLSDAWPLFGLSLRTPRLELHPVRDDDLPGLAAAALAGIHDPDLMPFGVPWTDAEPDALVRGLVQHQWRMRTSTSPNNWQLAFSIVHDGTVIGSQDVSANDFSTLKTVTTGSWLTQSSQGIGLGKEMRAAVLMFAFDHLGADYAETSAASWNAASIGVTRALGYTPNGIHRISPRPGQVTDDVRFRLDKASFIRPSWELSITGLERVLSQLLG